MLPTPAPRPGLSRFCLCVQDSTYVALEPADVVTVWLALTPSDASNGGVCFQPGSHLTQLPHVDTSDSGNLLLKGQTIQASVWCVVRVRAHQAVDSGLVRVCVRQDEQIVF
jgi:hypothetical protein